ncbi:sugar phosphate isomerase/epimerase [Actinoplanes campanulatus]|uniref:Sugar phosphate isomerase/epimerase n=1 Tax=Actinoplanes campanulatus TaxID=113559 RepID=A0A7W5AH79_9ACTN|nr:sugar phosphate isomerase/epimerase [Actinoplanes campanulatus]MBB3095654.1 sugar phosphate isomerase/epimerase [Actinoplanes campanulatus]GGN10553.1 sugar phosphate isomerase [Actinoplanes campanulatus]GID36548.1 sugar phosphate isomerase [Actinoplanes campanulatus]
MHESPSRPSALSRRNLLGAAAAGATATAIGSPAAAGGGGAAHRVPRDQISVQLYTLRNQLAIDLEGSLAELAEIGYTRVEHAGFVGRTAAQFRAALDNAGLRATSGHAGIPQPWNADTWKRTLDDAAVVGNRFIVHPYFGTGPSGPIRDGAVYRAFAADLNSAGELARKAGLSFGYHNHHNEFLRQTGTEITGFDILTGETDPRLVHLEVDIYWAWRGAADPVDLIERNRRRIKQVHVKDMTVSSGFADPGDGLIDFERVFRRAHEAGLIEYIVERDDAGSPPRTPEQALDTARVGYQYLAGLRY